MPDGCIAKHNSSVNADSGNAQPVFEIMIEEHVQFSERKIATQRFKCLLIVKEKFGVFFFCGEFTLRRHDVFGERRKFERQKRRGVFKFISETFVAVWKSGLLRLSSYSKFHTY